MYSKLYNKVNYTAPIDYLISTNIREYDISKANINTLLFFNKISKEQYDYFYNLEKEKRNIIIGNLVRDNEEIKEIDARPSDAIAVAIRVNAPIFVSPSVLAEGAISSDLQKDQEEAEEFKNFIQSIKPSDFEKLLKDNDNFNQ